MEQAARPVGDICGAADTDTERSVLRQLLTNEQHSPVAATGLDSTIVMGECTDERHPSLYGRVRVCWQQNGRQEAWLPSLHQLSIRAGDRVLIASPENALEPVVIGVVDGSRTRAPQARSGPALSLQRDESLLVCTREGQELLEVYYEESGPVLKLLNRDVDIEMDGDLRISADSIGLLARRGEAQVTASGDVVINGETVRVNCENTRPLG